MVRENVAETDVV